MGIKGLMKLLSENADGCYKTTELKNYMGRVVAIDASMQLYQFMSMVRSANHGGPAQLLADEQGETTSHLMGFFFRTIRLMEKGLKPVYVFDGKPPELKSGELEKRRAEKKKAQEELKSLEEKLKDGQAENAENVVEAINKAQQKNLSVTKQHNADAQKLLRLMGVPVFLAPCEAEAQCAELCKKGKVWATVTEDMDALTFGTPILLRNLTYAESRKMDIYEIHYDKILPLLELTQRQFVDLCILCGCDYASSIKGIGPKSALKLIKEHKTLEGVVESLDKNKYTVPEELANPESLAAIRKMFETPEVTASDGVQKFTWENPDVEKVIEFLVKEKNFGEERIRNGLKRLSNSRKQTSQRRMDSFFKPVGGDSKAFKRKATGNGKQKGKGGKRGRGRR